MNAFEQENRQAISFLLILIKNRYKIFVVVFVGIIGAISITYFAPKNYKSTAIVYPINSFTKNDLITNSQFGSEIDVDRFMQIIESEHIRDVIIKKFNLSSYYGIDSGKMDWKDKLINEFTKDITFSKSRFMSVIISAKMREPKLASDIVNGIINEANTFQKEIYMKNINTEMAYRELEYENQQRKTDSIVKLIYKIKDAKVSYNIIYNHLVSISKELISNETIKFVDSPLMEELVNNYKFEKYRLDEVRNDYEKCKLIAQKPFPNIYVIDYAQPSFRKLTSYRFSVLIGIFSSLFISILYFFVKERAKYLSSVLKTEDES